MPFASFGWQHTLEAVVSIVAAYVLALPLAFERKIRGETEVGLRTVPLVSVGACGYLIVTRFLYEAGVFNMDGLGRTLRSVMTGIGFIGGGVIVKQTREVQGLTTGASVWSAGAIGSCVAHGHYMIAIAFAMMNVVVLEVQRGLAKHMRRSGERT